jgi:hypothetical protein
LSFIPYVGGAVALGMGIVMSLLDWGGWFQLGGVIVAYTLIQLLESFVITPKVVGDKVGLSALWVLVALSAGGELFGFMGVLLALPAAAVLKIFIVRGMAWYRTSSFFLEEAPDGWDDDDAAEPPSPPEPVSPKVVPPKPEPPPAASPKVVPPKPEPPRPEPTPGVPPKPEPRQAGSPKVVAPPKVAAKPAAPSPAKPKPKPEPKPKPDAPKAAAPTPQAPPAVDTPKRAPAPSSPPAEDPDDESPSDVE